MPKIALITFDLDNTLWDVKPALLAAEREQRLWLQTHRPGTVDALDEAALLAFKKTLWRENPHLAHDVSQFRKQLLLELQLRAGYGNSEASKGAEEAFAVFLQHRRAVQPYGDAAHNLALLSREFRLAALTNGNADIYQTALADFFEFAYRAEELGSSKPEPAIFEAAVKHSGIKPEQIVHVGDNPEHDILGAQRVGFRSVWKRHQDELWPGHLTPADAQINELSELPAAIAALAAN